MEERKKLPKNVRQVGERDEMYRIYLEDYVSTYLERCMSRQGEITIGVLVGESCVIEGNACLFVNGAMEVNHVWSEEDQLLFSEYSWERMLESKTRYFKNGEICGCFICGSEEILPDGMTLQKLQNRYFPETGSVMLLYSREDSSFHYQNMTGMSAVKGYYVYYERNEPMQNFLVEGSQGRQVERASEEVVVNQFREKMSEKKNMKTPSSVRFAYGLCACLALTVSVLGISMMSSSARLQNMENLLTGFLEQADGQEVGATVSQTDAAGGKLTIYDVTGEAQESTGSEESAPENTSAQAQESSGAEDESAGASEAESVGASEDESAGASEAESAGAENTQEANGGQEETSGEAAGVTPEETQAPEPEGETTPAQAEPQETPAPEQETTPVSAPEEPGQEQPSSEQSANAVPDGYALYQVQAGDTLTTICMTLYGSSDYIAQICEINGIADANMISTGQQILVPQVIN